MGWKNHDELTAEAHSLTAESPRILVRRVRRDMLDEAHFLERAIASRLRARSAVVSRTLGAIALDDAEELARRVADGRIDPADERLTAVDERLVANLRAAVVEAERLRRFLIEA